MFHISPAGKKNNRSSLLSLENNYRHANGGAKTLTIKKLKSVYLFRRITVPKSPKLPALREKCLVDSYGNFELKNGNFIKSPFIIIKNAKR